MLVLDGILQQVAGLLTAFLLAYISIPSIVTVARKKQLVDNPGGRRVHTQQVPNLGGLAVFAGFTVAFLMFSHFGMYPKFQFLLAAVIVIFFIGVKDDIMIIAPITKFMGQLVAGFVVVVPGNIRFTDLHGFSGINEIPYVFSVLLTIFVILVIINAFNFVDGIDGLSSGLGILSASTYGVWFLLHEETGYSLLAWSLTGALMAFFGFNVWGRRNKVFMGDTGAQLVGLVVAVLTIQFTEMNILAQNTYAIPSAPSVAFGILVIPLVDTLRVVFIRFVISRSLFKADKNHFHHQLLALGFTHKQATFTILGINLLFIVLVFTICRKVSIRRLMLLILVIAMFINYIPAYFIVKRRRNAEKRNAYSGGASPGNTENNGK